MVRNRVAVVLAATALFGTAGPSGARPVRPGRRLAQDGRQRTPVGHAALVLTPYRPRSPGQLAQRRAVEHDVRLGDIEGRPLRDDLERTFRREGKEPHP